MKRLRLLSLFLILLILVSGCNQNSETKAATSNVATTPFQRTEFMMGTIVTIKIYDKDKEEVLKNVFNRIEELADQITTNVAGSEVDQINKNAGEKPINVSNDLYELIHKGKLYSERSEGSFDITIGPVTNLWRIGFPDARVPNPAEIREAIELIDHTNIELNDQKKEVYLTEKGMELDLGGIAKGFIADEAVKVLEEHQVQSAIIDLGGNVIVYGLHPSGNEWTVGIQNPFSARGEIIGKITATDKSIVTSGIYERYLEVNNKTYHHLLNPIDGYPFDNELAGITVITDKSVDGDALSTAVFSKGLKDGFKLIEEQEDIDAIFITKNKEIYITSGVKEIFELTNKEEFILQE